MSVAPQRDRRRADGCLLAGPILDNSHPRSFEVSDGLRGRATPRVGVLTRTLRQHPAPRFLVVGFVTFLVDIGSLELLHGVFRVGLALSTVIAYGIAFSVNFLASRQWTFATTALGSKAQRQLLRYLVLVVINLCVTLLIVVGLSAAGVSYLLAKVISVCLIAVGNFFAYRHWVFAIPSAPF
jgi:putative flippase GtrA